MAGTKRREIMSFANGLIGGLAAALILFSSLPADAHHIRGLPHYGYSENYPQIPKYEEIRVVQDWQIVFTYIKIFETKNCDLAVYIKDLRTGKPYDGAVVFKVFAQWERAEQTHALSKEADPTHTYRVGWVYEKDGMYTTRITFRDGERVFSEDFRMQMGDIGFPFGWFVVPAAGVGGLVILIMTRRNKVSEKI